MTRVKLAVFALTWIAGCSTAVKDSGEYKRLATKLNATSAVLSRKVHDLAKAKQSTQRLQSRVDDLNAEIAKLKEQYDPQIRAQAQAAWDTEVKRACAAAGADSSLAIADVTKFDAATMGIIGDQATLIAAVDACASPERAKSAEQKQADRLATCALVEPDQVNKDAESATGKCFIMFVVVNQFDSNTGPCSFQGNISAVQHTASYEYTIRSQFGLAISPIAQQLDRNCPSLNGIDQDDFVKIWAIGIGPYSYSTTIGGSNSIPAWKIEKIELIRKA